MIAEHTCPTCNQAFREQAAEAVLKRPAAHDHRHHGGPERITPELEAQLRALIREVPG